QITCIQTQCDNNLLPTATRMAVQQPAAVPVTDAETVMPVVVRGTACCPAVPATGRAFQMSKQVDHWHCPPRPLPSHRAEKRVMQPTPAFWPSKTAAIASAVRAPVGFRTGWG